MSALKGVMREIHMQVPTIKPVLTQAEDRPEVIANSPVVTNCVVSLHWLTAEVHA